MVVWEKAKETWTASSLYLGDSSETGQQAKYTRVHEKSPPLPSRHVSSNFLSRTCISLAPLPPSRKLETAYWRSIRVVICVCCGCTDVRYVYGFECFLNRCFSLLSITKIVTHRLAGLDSCCFPCTTPLV